MNNSAQKNGDFTAKISWNSVRVRLTALLCAFLMVLAGLLVGWNYYAINQFQKQIEEYNYRILTQYIGQIDINMRNLDDYLSGALAASDDLQILNGKLENVERDDRILAAVRLNQMLTATIQQYRWLHSFSILDGQEFWVEVPIQKTLSVPFKNALREYLREHKNSGDRWQVDRLAGQYYVLRIIQSGNVYVCMAALVEDLMISMELLDKEFSETVFLTDSEGEVIYASGDALPEGVSIDTASTESYITGKDREYSIIQRSSEKSDMQAVVLYKRSLVQNSLARLNRFLPVMILGVLLIGFFVYGVIKKMVITPLGRLQMISNDILVGKLDSRLSVNEQIVEFSAAYRSINKMLDRIQTLKVGIYEEQLINQRLEIEKLQQQIKPHFLLNSFNLIYSMAQEGDFLLIQQMCLNLSRYFRYRISSGRNLVPLAEEVECVKNYLQIQEFRYMGEFEYHINISPELKDAAIVPLMLQTFAENAILHALRSGKTMDFTIQAALIHYGKNDAICMEITDTGRGYPEEVLQAFRKDDAFINGRLGVGIKNVCRRLQLVYGNQARMILSNDTALGGARATVIIPYTKIQRNEGRG